MRRTGDVMAGVLAGAAGTTALNAVTYIDMAWRARPASTTPQMTVEKLAEATGVAIPGEDDAKWNRASAVGALTGMLTGVGVGAAYGLAHACGLQPTFAVGATLATAAAMAASNGPMTLLGITDPRTWSATDWASDVVPHLAYGLVTATAYAALRRP